MTLTISAIPSRGGIIARSVGYGAGIGAAAGGAVLLLPALLGLFGLLLEVPFAAGIGAVVGACCGLPGGVALALARSWVTGRPVALRLTGAAGASLPAALWENAELTHPVRTGAAWVAVLLAVIFALAFAAARAAFCGRRRQPECRISSLPAGARRE